MARFTQRFFSIADHLNEKSVPEPNSGCLLWLGSVSGHGYGNFLFEGRQRRPHREAYRLWVGPIPPGIMVCHKCDVRTCINPRHLFLGTSADNMRDAAAKGRTLAGTRNPNSKLTEEQVHIVRAAIAAGQTQCAIGLLVGVSHATVSRIANGVHWRNVGHTQKED